MSIQSTSVTAFHLDRYGLTTTQNRLVMGNKYFAVGNVSVFVHQAACLILQTQTCIALRCIFISAVFKRYLVTLVTLVNRDFHVFSFNFAARNDGIVDVSHRGREDRERKVSVFLNISE